MTFPPKPDGQTDIRTDGLKYKVASLLKNVNILYRYGAANKSWQEFYQVCNVKEFIYMQR